MTALSRLRPASLRGRVVLAVLGLLAVLLAGLFVAVDTVLVARLHDDLRTRLTDRVGLADQLDGALSPQQLVNRLRGDGVSALLCSSSSTSSGSGGRVRCVSADAAVPLPPARPRTAGPPQGAPPAVASRDGGIEQAGSVLLLRTTLPSSGQVLTLSVDSSQVGSTLHRLVWLEVVGGLVTLLVAALLLVRLVGGALRPLDRMTALARLIADGDRGRRLHTGRPDTELGRTATAFDGMLDALEAALADAAAAQHRLRSFLGDVSHELRTPLAGLAATTEALLRDEPDRAGRERAYVTLVRETQRAGRLVADLLTVTRLDTGMTLATERTDLAAIARQEAARLRLLAPSLTVTVAGCDPAPVDADPIRLGQVLGNLLGNARVAAGPAGQVTVHVAASGDGWVLDVVDSGPGVPEGDRERIFDRLVRLDAGRARDQDGPGREPGGFGLGLPIARALARAHGGDLVCLPDRAGARFRLTLPAVAPAGQAVLAGRAQ